jgi:RimJ/RimL family protein N-acetyltransferase
MKDAVSAFVLVPATQEDLAAMPPPLREGIATGFDHGEEALEELRAVLDQFEQVARPPEWSQFWSHDAAGGRYVGLVGFKSAPRDGAVEIAYFTFPRFEGRGFATAAIRHLVEHSGRAVKRVIAHTLPKEGSSNSALKRCGFAFAGEVVDPEDGPVWRWVRDSA